MNIPNILTVLRILITPLFVIFLIRKMHGHALLVFILAGVSDGLDGLIARLLNQRSELGALLDPIADKLLLTAAYISLGILKTIPGWLAVVVISRDVLIVTGIAVLKFANIPFAIRPTRISKWTTVFQLLTIGVALLDMPFAGAAVVKQALYWTTITMTILSGLHYTYRGLTILQSGFGNYSKRNG
ncbi:MAG: CDP-alcohol phosphatidyltransferase family protein [Deltaproteobacteria bacterium]|nr:CDP-alcohol phosphatidyltransferase family protein [Deltaproteobacteria bacterium]